MRLEFKKIKAKRKAMPSTPPTLTLNEVADTTHIPLLLSQPTTYFSYGDDTTLRPDVQKTLYWINALKNGPVATDYTSHHPFQRLQTHRTGHWAPSFVTVRGSIRTILCSSLYHDIDIVNCQPSILLFLARRHGVKVEALESYINDRDAAIQQVMRELQGSKAEAKKAIIATLNSSRNQHPESLFLRNIFSDAKKLQDLFWGLDEYAEIREFVKKRKDWNWKGSLISHIFQSVERQIILKAYEFLISHGHTVAALIYDGLLLKRQPGMDIGQVLRALEAAVADVCPVRFSEKSWDLETALQSLPVQEVEEPQEGSYEHWLGINKHVQVMDLLVDPSGSVCSLSFSAFKDFNVQYKDHTKNWLEDPQRPRYERYARIPPTVYVPPTTLKVWTPYLEQAVHGHDETVLDMFKKHIFALSGDSAEHAKYILVALKNAYLHPENKAPCIIFYGKPGCGKSFFFDLILGSLFPDNVVTATRIRDAVGNYSGTMLLRGTQVVVNEWNGLEHKNFEDQLKQLITETQMSYEQKNIKTFTAPSFHRVWASTNEVANLPCGEEDRRYVLMECSDTFIKDFEFFAEYKHRLQTHNGIQTVLSFILGDDIPSPLNLHNHPLPSRTDVQAALQYSNTPPMTLLMYEILGKQDMSKEVRLPAKFGWWVEQADLYGIQIPNLRFCWKRLKKPGGGFQYLATNGQFCLIASKSHWRQEFEKNNMDPLEECQFEEFPPQF